MQKNIFLLLLFVLSLPIMGQDIIIDFAGEGATTKIDSVELTNIANCTKISLSGIGSFNLFKSTIDISEINLGAELKMSAYPNPFVFSTKILLTTEKSENVNLSVFNSSGQLLNKFSQKIKGGTHSFNFSPNNSGVFIVSAVGDSFCKSLRVVCKTSNSAESQLIYKESVYKSKAKASSHKSSMAKFVFENGDRIKLKAFAGEHTVIITDVPTASKTYTFNFAECKDFQKNNYPIVKIGNQVWMAENVKSTVYSNGDIIPHVADKKEWASFDDDPSLKGYCYYGYDASNADKYGPLYNYSALMNGEIDSKSDQVQGVCPTGWHVPSNTEWNDLSAYLNMGDNANVLMDKCGELSADNVFSTNESGFSGLPGGFLYGEDLAFKYKGYNSYWWSATKSSDACVWYRYVSSGTYLKHDAKLRSGFSARCIKD